MATNLKKKVSIQVTGKNSYKKILDTFDPLADDVSTWFELSYAQYLTIPRSVLEAMPMEWQNRFTKCLYELDNSIDWRPKKGRYWVQLKDDKGRYYHDPLMNYRHANVDHLKIIYK